MGFIGLFWCRFLMNLKIGKPLLETERYWRLLLKQPNPNFISDWVVVVEFFRNKHGFTLASMIVVNLQKQYLIAVVNWQGETK